MKLHICGNQRTKITGIWAHQSSMWSAWKMHHFLFSKFYYVCLFGIDCQPLVKVADSYNDNHIKCIQFLIFMPNTLHELIVLHLWQEKYGWEIVVEAFLRLEKMVWKTAKSDDFTMTII